MSAVATDADQVRAAVVDRSRALAARDAAALNLLMHPRCSWSTHTGVVLTRDEYVVRNTTIVVWRSQHIEIERLTVIDAVAIVNGVAEDVIDSGATALGFRMPVTLTWWRDPEIGWRLLAGHAGPRI